MKIKYLEIGAGVIFTIGMVNAATLTSGHVDAIGIGYVSGVGFEPHSHASAGTVIDGSALLADEEYEPGDLTIQVAGTFTRPSDTVWAPTGVPSGESLGYLSEVEVPGEPFIGLGAEELTPADWSSAITIKLTGIITPPGAYFSLWQTDTFGDPTFYMSTFEGDGTEDKYEMNLGLGDHEHFGWGFTKIGDYALTFDISGTHVTDGFQSATATYNFSVVPEPSAALMSILGMALLARRRR